MYFYRLICLWLTIVNAIASKELTFHERNKTMMNQNQSRDSGTFSAQDSNGNPIILQWQIIDGKSEQLTQSIKKVSDILIQTYTQQELEFARKHPEAVKDEHFLKSLASLFVGSTIDWNIVESRIKDIFTQFFTTTDFAQFSKKDEKHIFVTVVDKSTGKIIGFIQFISGPEYSVGSIKAGMFGVISATHDHGLQELLMCSIFKIVPEIQRMFIHVRATNKKALALYHEWGFVPMGDQQGYWMNLEYNAQSNSKLQKIAQSLT